MVHKADSDKKVLHCLEAIQSLRPHVTKDNVLSYVNRMQKQDYNLIYVEEDGKAVAFSGYRFLTHFFSDDVIYIDDLGTIEAYRGKGYGSILLNYIIQLAKEKNLAGVRLDSGHHRHDAHRLYLNKGFKIVSHNFNLSLK
ncbi:MAG: GNAT family N-acetyltransferase [Chitinophagales bacterium]